MNKVGEYVECDTCAATWKPEVLSIDPAAGGEEFEAEFEKASRRVMVMIDPGLPAGYHPPDC